MGGAAPASPAEVLAGLVERVTFHNAENGFCVLRVKARGQRDLVTVVGHSATISAGEFVQMSGTWVNDRTHGLQFRAAYLRASPPTTLEGIERYLGSGMIRGIGPVYARKLIRAFGEAVFDLIEQSPDRLREVVGEPEQALTKLIALVQERIPAAFGLDAIRDVQVLCPMNRGALGAQALNVALQAALNPPGEARVERFGWTFCPGDKVMQVQNDYDRDVYNGDVGIVSGIDPREGEVVVRFDGREVTYGFGELDELVLAYAITIHKSQGSEYPAVVVPLVTQHYAMLARNLLYTGVTRGKRLVVLVGQRKALAIAVRNVSGRRRWSKLRAWLEAFSALGGTVAADEKVTRVAD
jgi:ATP-dependent exoDNAse (exonuclease V) alpha subunit